mmetsp:Transcript_25228/g.75973  ORF Transcript_25228/g.75973 Transcript_25228/m.75973 type:complete len:395 (+) Transcript_25228:180-1364(+)
MGDAAAIQGAVVAAKVTEPAGIEEEEPTILLEDFFVKKAPNTRHKAKKRYFVLYSDGMIRYFVAVSPEGEHVSEKGNFRVFKDTQVSTGNAGKKGEGKVLLITALDKCGIKDREWHLTADSAEIVSKWRKTLEAHITDSKDHSEDHRAAMERRKAVEGGVMKKLGTRVAGTLASAKSTMRSFGFSGGVTVSGSLLGLSVSMGLEIEQEEGEGEMEINPGEGGAAAAAADAEGQADDAPTGVLSDDDDDDFEAGEDGLPKDVKFNKKPADAADEGDFDDDPTTPEDTAKKSAFKRGIKNGMKKAMGKVKILAFEMKKYRLTGTIGVGFDMTIFGTGIEVEFEINLTSCITETEFQEMLQHEEELKQTKLEKKGKGRKDSNALQSSRRMSAAPGGD